MKRKLYPVLFVALLAGLAFVSCGDDDEGMGHILVQFITADQAGSIDDILPVFTLNFTNQAGQVFSIEKLVYFVSRMSLVRTDGSAVTSDEIAYIDASRGLNERRVSFASVPAGTYHRLRFTFGLNATDNVSNTLTTNDVVNANNQDLLDMAWPDPLGGGYHYMKMEGKYRNPASTDTLTYATHTGNSGATNNAFTVDIPIQQFTLDQDERWVIEVFHLFRQWYENPTQYAFPATAMIMNDPVAQATLKANGATVFAANRSYQDN